MSDHDDGQGEDDEITAQDLMEALDAVLAEVAELKDEVGDLKCGQDELLAPVPPTNCRPRSNYVAE